MPYVQNGEENRLEALKRQLAEAVACSKVAQNAAVDSEANWRSSSTLLEACKQNTDTADAYVQAAQRFIHSAAECRYTASAALEAHSRFHKARQETVSAICEAHEIEELLKASAHSGPDISHQVFHDQHRCALVARRSIALSRCTEADRALKDAQERVEHSEFVLGHLKSSLACREDALHALQQVLGDREEHHLCAQELLHVGSDLRATRRQLKIVTDHAAEVCIDPFTTQQCALFLHLTRYLQASKLGYERSSVALLPKNRTHILILL